MDCVTNFDVLIPAYNAEETIKESVGSIQAQTRKDIRIIVVNDGSTDRTGEVLRDIASTERRLTIVDTSNKGVVSALNTACSYVSAPFVARHDADDIAFPDRFERQLAYLETNPDCVAVGANAWHINDKGIRYNRTHMPAEAAGNAQAIPSKEPYLMHPFLMMRSDALLKAGGYRYVYHAEDTDLYWRLLSQGRLHNLNEILGEYRIHQGSVSSKSVRNGRIAAIYSQLAALSFRRREDGRPDIEFPSEGLGQLNTASRIDDLLSLLSYSLTADERQYLRIATAAKMLELASYRPYQLDLDDCIFIRCALRADRAKMSASDRGMVRWHTADVLLRLTSARHWRRAVALRPQLKVFAVLANRIIKGVMGGSVSK